MTDMITAEEAVQRFLNEYHAWILAGATTNVFTRNGGLCKNLFRWLCALRQPVGGYPTLVMQELWTGEGLHSVLPFDDTVDGHYYDYEVGVCHQNKARIDFVARHAK